MRKTYDLIGKKFGRLLVVGKNEKEWLCQCDCGGTKTTNTAHLINGDVRSCGCLNKEHISKLTFKHGHAAINSHLYRCWAGMKRRCYDRNSDSYFRYGDRGISVCGEWRNDFISFRDWAMKHGYKESLTLDRKDGDGNYEPSNCRWATVKEQAINRKTTIFITINGITKTISDWATFAGIGKSTISRRYKGGIIGESLLHKGRLGVSYDSVRRQLG